eukprot:TRINITY_DN2987_c0_g1_i1.p1 TRINITY_DN2987_c0_g1~~TRINITY_DN2987_c0_g1_i1.p1  ORF type:complete len:227 (+),score=49.32 TRINITY_DN2987_c0_g1_i1:100-780(+)
MSSSKMFIIFAAGFACLTLSSAIAPCPGEGGRYGDHKCNHDETHRVCAQLLNNASGQPLAWGSAGDFWKITGQESVKWDAEIRKNHGDSWCICMWATANLIKKVGCANVHLRCDSTDVKYVMKKYSDGGTDLKVAHECLQQKCPGASFIEEKGEDSENDEDVKDAQDEEDDEKIGEAREELDYDQDNKDDQNKLDEETQEDDEKNEEIEPEDLDPVRRRAFLSREA